MASNIGTVSGSWIYQESADILSKLALSGRGAVVVLDDLVVERCAHADSATGEVGVEVLNGGQWWIKVDLNLTATCPSLSSMPAGGSQYPLSRW